MGYCAKVDGVGLELRPESVVVAVEGEEAVEFGGDALGRIVAACVKVGLTGPYNREALMPLVQERED